MKKISPKIAHDEAMIKLLRKNPALAAEYLNAALDSSDEPQILLAALRQLAEAHGGMSRIAKSAGLQRESLYRALSPKGNPTLSTLRAVAHALGLQFTFKRANAA